MLTPPTAFFSFSFLPQRSDVVALKFGQDAQRLAAIDATGVFQFWDFAAANRDAAARGGGEPATYFPPKYALPTTRITFPEVRRHCSRQGGGPVFPHFPFFLVEVCLSAIE